MQEEREREECEEGEGEERREMAARVGGETEKKEEREKEEWGGGWLDISSVAKGSYSTPSRS